MRSVYHLKEGDPHTFAVPRLSGRAKAAMVEIQADEYGGGSRRAHAQRAVRRPACATSGSTPTYGALWDDAPGGRLRLGQHDVAVRAAPPLARRRARPPGRRGDDVVRAEPPVLGRPAPAGLRRADDGLLRRARRGRRRPRADRLGRHVRLARRRRARSCGPTSSSAPPARWPWTAWPPATCWAPGRRGARHCAGHARWPPELPVPIRNGSGSTSGRCRRRCRCSRARPVRACADAEEHHVAAAQPARRNRRHDDAVPPRRRGARGGHRRARRRRDG